ncbi:MAG: hypothetical protein IKO47_05210 [Ruminococcus sp.]|nr:hypothetical protein [Ruminococcus sp.]
MKKDMLNELSGFDPETVDKIAENAPELDKAAQKRILSKCLDNTSGRDEITVSGTERYVRPKYRSFAAAAAALVLVGGIGGAFAVGRKISRNATSESDTALITTDEDGAVNGAAENTTVQEVDLPVQTDTEGPAVQQPDCTEPASYQEYKVPENVDNEQYEAWMKQVPEEYWDVVRNLKPGEVIHLPCFPVKEIPTDSGETTTCPPQTTTLPPDTTVPPQTTTEPDTEPTTKKTPDMYNPMTNQAVIQPIDGYWTSDWCGSSYWYFDSQNRCGTYYNSNTCSGFHFNYNYYTSDSRIELSVLDREIGYSGELYGTGNVVWITDDNFYISWKPESPIRQGGDSFERFVRNKSESMPEGEDMNKPQPE